MKLKLLIAFILGISGEVYSKGDYGCIQRNNYSFCNLESDIEGQILTKNDVNKIIEGFKVLDKEVDKKYSGYTYKGATYTKKTLIYSSKENGAHVYIVRLWFGDKSCEVSVNYNPISFMDDDSIWCENKRYKK